MKRIRALVLHEMRTLRWFILVGILCALAVGPWLSWGMSEVAIHYNDKAYDMFERGGSIFSEELIATLQQGHMTAIFLFAILVTIQFAGYHKRKNVEFLSSLPYTHREKFFAKVFSGYGVITLCCMALLGVVMFVRNQYIGEYHRIAMLSPGYAELLGNEMPWHTIRSVLIFWIILIAVYSIYSMVQNLINNTVLATLVGGGLILLPSWICIVLMYIGDCVGGTYISSLDYEFRLANILLMGTGYASVHGGEDGLLMLSYDNMLVVTGILLLIIAITIGSCLYVNSKKDLAREGILVPQKEVRIILSAGISICLGTAIIILTRDRYEIQSFIIGSAVIALILFLIFMKLLKRAVK